MSELTTKFEKDFPLVSCLSTSRVSSSAWYVDNGAYFPMTLTQELFTSLTKQDSRVHVDLGNDANYVVKGVGTILFPLKSSSSLEVKDALYVSGLIKPKGSIPDTAQVIGVREDNLYMLWGELVESLCDLWHKRIEHLHCRVLLILSKIVTSPPDFNIEQQGVCKGCALGKHAKASFLSSESRSKEILVPIHSDVCGTMLLIFQ
jgi:hypothetical protein